MREVDKLRKRAEDHLHAGPTAQVLEEHGGVREALWGFGAVVEEMLTFAMEEGADEQRDLGLVRFVMQNLLDHYGSEAGAMDPEAVLEEWREGRKVVVATERQHRMEHGAGVPVSRDGD